MLTTLGAAEILDEQQVVEMIWDCDWRRCTSIRLCTSTAVTFAAITFRSRQQKCRSGREAPA